VLQHRYEIAVTLEVLYWPNVSHWDDEIFIGTVILGKVVVKLKLQMSGCQICRIRQIRQIYNLRPEIGMLTITKS